MIFLTDFREDDFLEALFIAIETQINNKNKSKTILVNY